MPILTLKTVDFHNQSLLTFEKDGVFYTAMKPICENIGLDWTAQRQRINRDEVLSQGAVMITTPTKGGEQEMLCLPIQYLNGWLFGVDVSRVKAEIKDKIIMYKKECYQVLHDYWNKGVAVNPRRVTISVEQQACIRQAISKRCQAQSVHYQTIYSALQKHFNIPRYVEILEDDFQEALSLIWKIELPQIALPEPSEQPFFLSKNMAREFSARLTHIYDLVDLLDDNKITRKIKQRSSSLEQFLIQYEKNEHPKGVDLA